MLKSEQINELAAALARHRGRLKGQRKAAVIRFSKVNMQIWLNVGTRAEKH